MLSFGFDIVICQIGIFFPYDNFGFVDLFPCLLK
jgi:hypothetical protein